MDRVTQPSLSQRCRSLYGRNDEIATLRSLLERCERDTEAPTQLVFVDAPSGTGKSALIREALHPPSPGAVDPEQENFKKKKTLLMQGKFEEIATKPFAALDQALCALAQQLEGPVADTLNEKLGRHEKASLVQFCADFALVLETDMFSVSSGWSGVGSRASGSSVQNFDLSNLAGPSSYWVEEFRAPDPWDTSTNNISILQGALRAVFRILGEENFAFIWVLDDLQWIDPTSLTILQAILRDERIKKLLFVGAYRTDEISVELETWIETLHVPKLHLGPLSMHDVEDSLRDMMKLAQGTPGLRDLAELVHQRTSGNPFYVMQFIDLLEFKEIFRQSSVTLDWTWDLEEISTSFSSQENDILGIVVARISQLSPEVQKFLQLASCLGSQFEIDLLRAAFPDVDAETLLEPARNGDDSDSDSDERKVDFSFHGSLRHLDTAEHYGLVEVAREGVYRFSHDKIYEASLGMIADENREQLHWTLGCSVLNIIRTKKNGVRDVDDYVVFVCTDQLNIGANLATGTEDELMEFAELNFEASKRAARLNAYIPATSYLRTAIQNMEMVPECWEKFHDILVKMYRCLVQVCLCCGRLDEIPAIAEVALKHCQDNDRRFRIRYASLQRLVMMNNISELIDESLEILGNLGEHFSKSPPESLVKKRCTLLVKRLSTLSDNDILCLNKLEDQNSKYVLELISTILSHVQYFSSQLTLNRMLLYRALEITLDEGLSTWGPDIFGFAAFALFDENLKQRFDVSIRMSNLAIALAKERGGKRWRKLIAPHAITFRHWTQPYSLDVDDFFKIYEEDLKRGELITAFQAVYGYLYSYYHSGLDLRYLVRDCDTIATIKMEYSQNLRLLHMLPIYQLILNLTGRTDDILDMYNGKAMDFRKKLGWGEKTRGGEEAQWSFSMHLYVYCEEFEKAYEMYDKVVVLDIGPLKHFPLWHLRVFFFAIISIQRAKKAPWVKRGKLRRQVDKHMSLMRMWVMKRNAINLVHKYQLLEAEILTLDRKYPSDEILISAFDKAIRAASKSGFLQDAALGAALASRALRAPIEKEHYARLAQASYSRWGALGVVQHLQKHSDVHRRVSQQEDQRHSSSLPTEGIRSRRRFTLVMKDVHKRGSEAYGNQTSFSESYAGRGGSQNFSESLSARRGSSVSFNNEMFSGRGSQAFSEGGVSRIDEGSDSFQF